jgi:GDPmannose 4,6-dehydratase
MARRALITGITGQDGSYLAELLLEKGYEVHGIVRPSGGAGNVAGIRERLTLHEAEVVDARSLVAALAESEPDEIYNLAAVTQVPASWGAVTASADITALGVARLLEGIVEICPAARFFQASSSEMLPDSAGLPQDESTPLAPRSAYGAAKAYGHFLTSTYRRRHDLFACSGILFNHESPRRGLEFVTRRVTRGAAAIKLGLADELPLGNLQARRDWGYAPEYMEAAWAMLQAEEPDDYVIGTGEQHSVAELADAAFAALGLSVGQYLKEDPAALRPEDHEFALSDPSKARRRLGWSARMKFGEIVRTMAEADLAALAAENSNIPNDDVTELR